MPEGDVDGVRVTGAAHDLADYMGEGQGGIGTWSRIGLRQPS
jgi:hypothetical protein